MTRHESCLLSTAELELDLFGAVVSESVLDYLQAMDWRYRMERITKYGGSRALWQLENSLRPPECRGPSLPDPGLVERR